MQKEKSEADYDLKILAALRKQYPHASEEQLLEGKMALERYVELIDRITERLKRESMKRSFDTTSKTS